jgi:hypothetical protein
MPRARFRLAAALLAVPVLAGASAGWALSSGGDGHRSTRTAPKLAAASEAPATAGTAARFAFLSKQTSNSCGLEPAALARMPDRMRLQGSCCFPMAFSRYRSQVSRLVADRRIRQIPRDPHDVRVSQAKRLLSYERTIRLSAGQERTYRRAMRMSSLKGPCCCHCWRWDAFRGLSEYLIADRGWPAARIARLTELLEGCGGTAD